ncbi:hypothetical protein [Bradyrhizobium sp. CCBAU 45384]|uniref:hypothetical protein n=1 Tax=Bradyrhizobium sp. CCBAU 45384 TaxID=858428 RepID=UPI0023055CF8|nr:hypothetical protein [Bradyrhizobium sp. CCBAU 45384]
MPGHRLPRSTRAKLKAGAVVRVRRGWRASELPARPASVCRRISPTDGTVIGLFEPHRISPPSAQLRFRHVYRPKIRVTPC